MGCTMSFDEFRTVTRRRKRRRRYRWATVAFALGFTLIWAAAHLAPDKPADTSARNEKAAHSGGPS
jgi:hypothetical protein